MWPQVWKMLRTPGLCSDTYHHHRHHWHNSPLWAIAFLGFLDNRIFRGWGCQPHAQPGGPGLRICDPGRQGDQLYPQALGAHFSRLLRHAWATLGLFLSSGHHTERVIHIAHIIFAKYQSLWLISAIYVQLIIYVTTRFVVVIIEHNKANYVGPLQIATFFFGNISTSEYTISTPSIIFNSFVKSKHFRHLKMTDNFINTR
jgi:F0F1-type ATP synthase assembly protein I